MIRVTFLGTAAAAPSVARNVSAVAVKHQGDLMLFDCGEGTQRQMMRFGTGFDVKDAFFTHLHADHFLGIVGFVRTLAMAGRTEPMRLYGPRTAGRILSQALRLGMQGTRYSVRAKEMGQPAAAEAADRAVGFCVEICELKEGDAVKRDGYQVLAVRADHRVPALSYVLSESQRPGRFNLERARELGIPEGPLFGRLQHGQDVTLPDGRVIRSSEVVGAARPGRTIALSGDTRPCPALRLAAANADLLVHEATFADDEKERAFDTAHSTAREAARLAREANVKRLVLTHLSARYDVDAGPLLREAREEFPAVELARDGMVVEVGFADAEKAPAAPRAPGG
jgi:ribonuclease Z